MSSEQQLFASFKPETCHLKDHNDGPCISRSCQYRQSYFFHVAFLAFVSLSVDAANEPTRSVGRLVTQSDTVRPETRDSGPKSSHASWDPNQ